MVCLCFHVLTSTFLILCGVGRTAPSTLVRDRREGWVRIRIAGQTDWKHLWMAVISATPDAPGGPPRPGSPPEPQQQHQKRRISSLFGSRDNSQSQSPSSTPLVAFYLSPKPKDRRKPFLTLRNVTQAFAVYPERPELINKSTLMKIEGFIGDEEIALGMRKREGWILVMPELEAGVPQANETIRWLIGATVPYSLRNCCSCSITAAFHDAFSLYGRPRAYSWDPHEQVSMMFAYPFGSARDVSFCSHSLYSTHLRVSFLFSHFFWNETQPRPWILGSSVPPQFDPVF
jgi:CCR4-NOT transcriptional complex subunit CAF120